MCMILAIFSATQVVAKYKCSQLCNHHHHQLPVKINTNSDLSLEICFSLVNEINLTANIKTTFHTSIKQPHGYQQFLLHHKRCVVYNILVVALTHGTNLFL